MITKKQIQVILCLGKTTREIIVSKIARKTDTTYTHCVGVIRKLEELGVVKTYKQSRCKFVFLTEKGWEIYKPVKKIWEVFDEDN